MKTSESRRPGDFTIKKRRDMSGDTTDIKICVSGDLKAAIRLRAANENKSVSLFCQEILEREVE